MSAEKVISGVLNTLRCTYALSGCPTICWVLFDFMGATFEENTKTAPTTALLWIFEANCF